MTHVIQTEALVEEGVISADQGAIIASRSRQVMVSLVINAVLCLGIMAAAIGFVFWLGDALAVAIVGAIFLGVGWMILMRTTDIYRMFGNAAALIGAGMLTFGAGIELIDKLGGQNGGTVLMGIGALAALGAMAVFRRSPPHARFLTGSLTLMGAGLHIAGLYIFAEATGLAGLPTVMIHLYVTLVLIGLGLLLDVRLITALAIVPFAQMLDTGTAYWHAVYAFYSPETTLSILQMAVAMAICVALSGRLIDRYRRHTHLFGIMAFIAANLCFLVGSLWGDVVGQSIWGPHYSDAAFEGDYVAFTAARDAFEASTLVIHEHVYSIVWAILLIAAAFWAARTHRRGIFNAAMTFGAIHAYTQMFESFGDEPLAYVIGGLAAIPLAWGLWRLNDQFESRNVGA